MDLDDAVISSYSTGRLLGSQLRMNIIKKLEVEDAKAAAREREARMKALQQAQDDNRVKYEKQLEQTILRATSPVPPKGRSASATPLSRRSPSSTPQHAHVSATVDSDNERRRRIAEIHRPILSSPPVQHSPQPVKPTRAALGTDVARSSSSSRR